MKCMCGTMPEALTLTWQAPICQECCHTNSNIKRSDFPTCAASVSPRNSSSSADGAAEASSRRAASRSAATPGRARAAAIHAAAAGLGSGRLRKWCRQVQPSRSRVCRWGETSLKSHFLSSCWCPHRIHLCRISWMQMQATTVCGCQREFCTDSSAISCLRVFVWELWRNIGSTKCDQLQ